MVFEFPLCTNPNVLQIPWIWDAVLDPIKLTVSLTSINRGIHWWCEVEMDCLVIRTWVGACDFNLNSWRKLAFLFPQLSEVLGGGIVENVLIRTANKKTAQNKTTFGDYFTREDGFLGKQFYCNYYFEDNLISTTKSWPISVKRDIRRVSPVVIFCPTSVLNFTSMSLSFISEELQPEPYNYFVYNKTSPFKQGQLLNCLRGEPL